MAVSELDAPLVDGGIANVEFFNGRILAAEDLRRLQAADREHRRILGLGLGSGVIGGLRVTRGEDPALLRVTAGAAINALGETIVLPSDIDRAGRGPRRGTVRGMRPIGLRARRQP
jgi:hypothetical protein